jgi:CHAT domain-containing protein/tetratricopeptide (TPR) repeat protein
MTFPYTEHRVPLLGQRIKNVHLKEFTKKAPIIRCNRSARCWMARPTGPRWLTEAFDKIGYRGYLTFEYFLPFRIIRRLASTRPPTRWIAPRTESVNLKRTHAMAPFVQNRHNQDTSVREYRNHCWLAIAILSGALSLLLGTTQARALDESAKKVVEESRRKAAELDKQAEELRQKGNHAEAVKRLIEALKIRERLFPADKFPGGHLEVAINLTSVGNSFYDMKEYQKAYSYYLRALTMSQRLFPKEARPQLAVSLNNMAVVLDKLGKLAEAVPYYEQALDTYQRLYPKEKHPDGHPRVADALKYLGQHLEKMGDYARALSYLERALKMDQQLYPRAKYPRGHPTVAHDLDRVGTVLQHQGAYARARPFFEQALAMNRELYPEKEHPQGHVEVADSLYNLGILFHHASDFARALAYLEQTLAMEQRLYPKDKFPHGHPEMANTLASIAGVLRDQGDYTRALDFQERALAVHRRFFPPDKYPAGTMHLSVSLNNMGRIYCGRDELAKALPYFQEALAMREKLFPKEQYPRGHQRVIESLDNVGIVLMHLKQYAQARPFLERALEMSERLFPQEIYPNGHPAVATCLLNLSTLLIKQGDFTRAEHFLRRALRMREQLFPKEQYPHGHPHLALVLINETMLLHFQEKFEQALPFAERATAMYQDVADHFLDVLSEAEAFNFAASLPGSRDALLSISRLAQKGSTCYPLIWRGKAALSRGLQVRQHAWMRSSDKETRQLGQQLLEKRQALSRLLLAVATPGHQNRLRDLTAEKEQLERRLAQKLPEFGRQQELDRLPVTALKKQLPRGMVFIDFLRYGFVEKPRAEGRSVLVRQVPSYVAFIVQPGGSETVTRVELGEAKPIETALDEWRRQIVAGEGGAQADTLRRLLWEPIAKHLMPGTETVVLAPDGVLARLPWAALPGKKKNTVLLEEYTVVSVPHGPFLLDQLSAPALARDGEKGLLLTVGNVRYDKVPPATPDRPLASRGIRQAERGNKKLSWPNLPGTAREVDTVLLLAGEKRTTRSLWGEQAGTGQLQAALCDDKNPPRWAHLATHGFFADARFRSVLQLDEKLFQHERFGERAAPGARNPLVLSGLVLAGANRASSDPLRDDGGILTAEAIAGMPLQKLELVVLSACETGLGEVAGGEGVFGLQRAFHAAGTRTVVASLWKVNDEATAVLMSLFYHKLWREGKPASAALREAQLELYRQPERLPTLVKLRGPDLERELSRPVEKPPAGEKRAAVKLWAGFTLSGLGQ